MKRILFTLLLLAGCLAGYSQMTNNGGSITVEIGATLVIEGDYTSTGTGTMDIDGEVVLKGDFVNNGGSIATGSFGQLTFNGTSAQEITGSASTTFYCAVEVDNASGVALTATAAPGASQVLDSTLILTTGKVTLNTFDLTLSNEGVTTPSATKYIVTNSTGMLKASVGASNYLFPVGSASAYNPVILNEAGTADTYGVTYAASTPAGWAPTDHAVVGTWTVTEGTPAGNNLTVTPGWNATDEQTNFDPTDCAVGVTADNGTTIDWKASGAAAGPDANGIYAKSGAGFTTLGQYVVGDYFFEGIDIDLDLFLAGAYNAGSMTTGLNSIIPLTDPYGNGINATSIPSTNVVDWVEIELRDQTVPATVVKSYSGFLNNDGNVLSISGTPGLKITGVAKAQYYVAVRHRNHLGAMTASPIDFTLAGPFAFDFSAGAGIYGTDAMRNMGADWALWAGDANGDGAIVFQGAGNDPTPVGNTVSSDPGNTNDEFTYIVNGYYNSDVNMDGQVIFQGAGNDPTPIGNSVSSHPGNTNDEFTFTVNDQLP